MKKHFNKEILMTKIDSKDFKNCNKCWICNNDYVNNNVTLRYIISLENIEPLLIEIVLPILN